MVVESSTKTTGSRDFEESGEWDLLTQQLRELTYKDQILVI